MDGLLVYDAYENKVYTYSSLRENDPVPYYSAIFRDKWYDISRLIAIGKMAKLKNHDRNKRH